MPACSRSSWAASATTCRNRSRAWLCSSAGAKRAASGVANGVKQAAKGIAKSPFGTAIKNTTDARYRSEAAYLATQIVGQMWVDMDKLDSYKTDGTGPAIFPPRDRDWFAGPEFTAADVQMSYPLEAAVARAGLDGSRPRLSDFLACIRARPAYQRAIERGGEVNL